MPTLEQRVHLIQQLHRSPKQVAFACTGGGSLVVSDLLTETGASQTVIEAHIPYSAESVARFIGNAPAHYCSSQTARQLAMTCFKQGQTNIENREILLEQKQSEEVERQRVQQHLIAILGFNPFNPDNPFLLAPPYRQKSWLPNLIGIGCSASLASNRMKQGDHRVHIAVQTYNETREFFLTLHKGARTRWEEERLVADCILQQLAIVAKLDVPFEPTLLPEEKAETRSIIADDSWIELLLGDGLAVLHHDGQMQCLQRLGDFGRPLISLKKLSSPEAAYMHNIFAGSFDPLHQGHMRMIELTQKRLAGPVALEITVQNVDKPPLDYREMEIRLEQIEATMPGQAVWLTRTPRFIDKAHLFPGSTFVVGADTLRRIGQQKYYGNNHGIMMDILRQITHCRCRFLVFARPMNGTVEHLQSLSIPDMLRSLCESVPEEEFCEDISSREIRSVRVDQQDGTDILNPFGRSRS